MFTTDTVTIIVTKKQDRMAPAVPPALSEAEPEPEPAPVLPPAGSSPRDSTGDSAGGSPYYSNCSAARAAGAAPLYRGTPGYRAGLDRGDEGVTCE